jgi:hypothetical protein
MTVNQQMPRKAAIRYSLSTTDCQGFVISNDIHAITILLASLDNKWKKAIRIMLQTTRYA